MNNTDSSAISVFKRHYLYEKQNKKRINLYACKDTYTYFFLCHKKNCLGSLKSNKRTYDATTNEELKRLEIVISQTKL